MSMPARSASISGGRLWVVMLTRSARKPFQATLSIS
jgi:hypothetical protein